MVVVVVVDDESFSFFDAQSVLGEREGGFSIIVYGALSVDALSWGVEGVFTRKVFLFVEFPRLVVGLLGCWVVWVF